jgi:hypothetical protein
MSLILAKDWDGASISGTAFIKGRAHNLNSCINASSYALSINDIRRYNINVDLAYAELEQIQYFFNKIEELISTPNVMEIKG